MDQNRNNVSDSEDVTSHYSERELIAGQSPSNAQNDDGRQGSERPVVYTTQAATLFILINVTVGLSLLALPYEMQQTGIIASVIIGLVFVFLITATCIMCTELTVKSDVKSYHEIIKVHCHPIVYQITQASILMIVFGTTVAYIAVIGDQSDRLFRTVSGSKQFCNTWYMNRRFIMIVSSLLFIKPLCAIKTIDFLKYARLVYMIMIKYSRLPLERKTIY